MKVNGNNSANFSNGDVRFSGNKNVKKSRSEDCSIKSDGSSSKALDSMGRAFVGMASKGKFSTDTSLEDFKFRGMSESEYDKYRTKLLKKLKKHPNENLRNHFDMYNCRTNKYNVQFFNGVLSNDKIYNSDKAMRSMISLMSAINSPDKAKLAAKLYSDEKLYRDTRVGLLSDSIVRNTKSSDIYDASMELLNKYLADDKLNTSPTVQDHFAHMVFFASSPERAKVADTVLSHESLYNNPSVMGGTHMRDLIWAVRNPKHAELKMNVLENLTANEALLGDEVATDKIMNIIQDVTNSAQAKAVNELLANEKLYSDADLLESCRSKVFNLQTEEQADNFLKDLHKS